MLKGAEPGRIRVAAMCAHTVSAREVISLRGQLVFVTKMTVKGALEMIFGGEKYIKNTTNC